MNRLADVGALLKKIYRVYSQDLLSKLQGRGFLDLRPSFLEILLYLCETQGPSIKEIGEYCGLKKQTMTSHLNDLENRGYILRKPGLKDRRELIVELTEYGEKFKFSMLECTKELEEDYLRSLGQVELERIHVNLENFYENLNGQDQQAMRL